MASATATANVLHKAETSARTSPASPSLWLRLSLVIAFLATAGSVLGLAFQNAIYGRETANWAAQAVGQDVANLIAFPAMAVAAYFAGRGSMRAYLVWMGLLVYSAYTYAIYTFALHFGPLFLVWTAVFGLSVYSLVGAFAGLDPHRISSVFERGSDGRFAARLVIGIGSAFALLWLSEIIPPMVTGTTPDALQEVGLLTNPVHVLDLALLLPALTLGGIFLLKGRPLGYVLVPVLLVATFFLAVGIVSLTLVSAARGLEVAPAVGVTVAVLAVVEAATAMRLLQRIE